MTIAFIFNDFTPGRGSERVGIALANALSARHTVFIIGLNQAAPEPFFPISGSVKTFTFNVPRKSLLFPIRKKQSEYQQLKHFVDTQRPDIVIGVGTYASGLAGTLARFRKHGRVFVGWEQANAEAVRSPFWRLVRKMTYGALDLLVCLNEEDARDMRKLSRRVLAIPNATQVSCGPASLQNKRMICIGALEQEKGVDLLIEAFARFNRTQPDWELLICGDGSLRATLQRQVSDRGLQHRIRFREPVKDICAELIQASFLVLPSRREGFGMVLLEAMASGVPCISFDCPTGPRHLIDHGVNGLLVPPANIELLAGAMSELAGNAELRASLAIAGKRVAARFERSAITRLWTENLSALVAAKPTFAGE